MKTKKKFYRILAVLVALILCFSFSGCGEKEKSETQQVSSEAKETKTQDTEINEDVQPVQETMPEPQVPEVEMCWDCGKLPASGTSYYCVNCKCMICDRRRKLGNYMYCSQHNCEVYNCAAMAVDNSPFCVSHKCAMPGCKNQAWSGSQYCAAHKQ